MHLVQPTYNVSGQNEISSTLEYLNHPILDYLTPTSKYLRVPQTSLEYLGLPHSTYEYLRVPQSI